MHEAGGNGDGDEPQDEKVSCFYKTLLLFKGHLQNRLSHLPDPKYPEKVRAWKESLKRNNIDPKAILSFFATEMQKFVESVTKLGDSKPKPRGMELLDDILAGKSLDPPLFKQLKSSVASKPSAEYIEGVAKKDQATCRACHLFFRKTDDNKHICPESACQTRKCLSCEEDRVHYRNKNVCKVCSGCK